MSTPQGQTIEHEAYTLDKSRVRRSFDRAAQHYDKAAILQSEVRQRMFERLALVQLKPQRIIDAGCGTGLGTTLLHSRYPQAQITALDFAPSMLHVSRARHHTLGARARTWIGQPLPNYVCGDLEALPLANQSAELLWSNLAIQWCNDLDTTFAEMHRVLAPEGLLMVSTFGPDTLKELRAATQADPHHVHVSRFIDMHDIGDALIRAGFTAPVLDVEHFELTYDDVKSVMRDLKAIGAHNATQGRHRGLLGRSFLAQLTAQYEQFRRNGKLPATYEVVYAHAWKPNTPPPLAEGLAPIQFRPRRS